MDNYNHNSAISFIVPAYNCAATVEEAVHSIMNGNFHDGDEIVIVDDASTDNTLAALQRLAVRYPAIKIIQHEENRGGAAARNTAVQHSSHGLIFCLDSDNVLEKNSIAPLKAFLLSSHSDAASFERLSFFKKNTHLIHHTWIFDTGTVSLEDMFYSSVIPPASGNYLFTKDSWAKAGGYPEMAGALDAWGFGFRQLATGAKMSVMPHSRYFHRFGNESYWVRQSQAGDISALARKIIEPYRPLIEPNIMHFIDSHPDTWFDDIRNMPGAAARHIKGKISYPVTKNIYAKLKSATPSFIKSTVKKLSLYLSFLSDYKKFKEASGENNRFSMQWNDRYPQLYDKTADTDFDTHYLYHPAWAARIIAQTKPKKHTDISSILHFSTLVSAFVPVEFYDYRPAAIILDGLSCGQADLTDLFFEDNSIESLSCMHTIEHIGLGRYGDPIDPDGDLKAMAELVRVLAPGGSLLFVTPVGKPRIQFNAHRIYSYEQIMDYFSALQLQEFSLIPDNGRQVGIVKDATKELADMQQYGCGCFWFKKP